MFELVFFYGWESRKNDEGNAHKRDVKRIGRRKKVESRNETKKRIKLG